MAILVQLESGAEVEISYLYGISALAFVLSLFDWTVGRVLPPQVEAYVQILGDLALVCLLVYSSGGPNSVFTFLYLVVIGAAAFLLYRPGAVIIASVASLIHGLLVELTAYEGNTQVDSTALDVQILDDPAEGGNCNGELSKVVGAG